MKKFVITAIAIFGLIFNLFADSGRGHCKIQGTNDYVEVTAYASKDGTGSFVISNGSSRPLVSAYIVITAECGYMYKDGEVFWNTQTIYSGNYTDGVNAYQSKSIDFNFNGQRSHYGLRNISVSVSNPSCQ